MRHRQRHPAHRRGQRPWWLGMLAGTLVAAVVAWLAVCVDVLVTPQVDPHGRVDAVYVLGPAETRIGAALDLMDQGLAPVLLATTSVREDGTTYATGHCGTAAATYRVECVLPDPYSTRGEAQVLGEQVAAHGWTRVAVLTSTVHTARARMLMERCVDAEVLMWTLDDRPDPGVVARLEGFVYQSAAWVKAQLERDC
ncbi:YdcF family protein [Ornithinimicrobium avium]|uniref:Uncharacterized protein n=1 Tax=Ornithinimicrobium avium TaxID=2283195 RepID=A0A345NPF1_9MICO|nr:ElyC/SanA/YdcF family protein [Ornithinimicrobium avium]AXH96909.1 hypothetical protein DV701_12995 [Ornithinimicrobium avium]